MRDIEMQKATYLHRKLRTRSWRNAPLAASEIAPRCSLYSLPARWASGASVDGAEGGRVH